MFGFLKKKVKEVQQPIGDWSFLGTDMHGHFIPGIDDGPEHMQESITLLRNMEEAGFTRIITTPHISLDYFPDTEPKIASALLSLQKAAAAEGMTLQIEAGAEYMIDESLLDKLHNKARLYTIGGKYILIEMGFVQVSPMLQQVIFEIQAAGYIPVLAHPERYNFYHTLPLAEFYKLKEWGCLFQLNTIALSGYYGKHVKILAEKLLKETLYDFAGSDVHHQRHVKSLESLRHSNLFETLQNYPFLNRII